MTTEARAAADVLIEARTQQDTRTQEVETFYFVHWNGYVIAAFEDEQKATEYADWLAQQEAA